MRIITPPSIEPITLDEVKTQLGISDTLQDDIITRRIIEARQYAENYTQRAFITQTQEIRLDDFPHRFRTKDNFYETIKLPYPNLLSIVSIKYIDLDGGLQTLDPSLYTVNTYDFIGTIQPVFGQVWPYARCEKNAVRIQQTCGYGPLASDVPDLIREAIMLAVGHWMNFQPSAENGVILSRIPYAVRDILDQFAVVSIV